MLQDLRKVVNLSKDELKEQIKTFQNKLSKLQQEIKNQKIPVIILLDGWSASGKGTMIGKINARLEPRGYRVYASKPAVGDEIRMPFLWRFWRDIPSKGSLAIFDKGWYEDILKKKSKEQKLCVNSINTFERQLTDDGYCIIKIFLQIDPEEQKSRMKELDSNKATSWRVTKENWKENKKFQAISKEKQKVVKSTDTPNAPWHIISNDDQYMGTHAVLKLICDELSAITQKSKASIPKPKIETGVKLLKMPKLKDVDLSCKIEDAEYKKELKNEKKKLEELHSLVYREKLPIIIAFEGWDAAGKGGAIRRLSWSLDPRGFKVSSIAAPTAEESTRHYLWRFWMNLSKDGHISMFDRSWYGRVMVERVEEFTKKERWQMAYDEINEFEKSLTDWGAIVLKFWVHIDKDTQLARFTERQNTPEKQFKITDEDWRNREKWEAYEEAVNEMIQLTSTENAPWIIVEGNDKKHARLKVIKTVRKAIEDRLK